MYCISEVLTLTLLTDVLDKAWIECLVSKFVALAVFESYVDQISSALEAVSKAAENFGLALGITSELLLTSVCACTEEGRSGYVFRDLGSFENE